MPFLRDLIYLLAALITAPIWLFRMVQTGKIRTDWKGRFGFGPTLPALSDGGRRLLLHAVSVGEVNAVRGLVSELHRSSPECHLVISVTTDTGYARAMELYGAKFSVVRYPFDASFAVRRLLNRVHPDLVALVELEVWPNLLAACRHRGIPVGVINGRLTERSARRYRKILPLLGGMFRQLAFVAVQDEVYAERFRALGVPEDRISVAGTMKWDNAALALDPAAADRLADALGLDRTRPLVVAGSTAPDEHALLVSAVSTPEVQLLCAPRKPEWFAAAAAVLEGCARRSRGDRGSETGRFLLDSIGELRAAYALADVIVIGRTFVPLGGSDMIEAASLGKAVIVGPHTDNFQSIVDELLKHNAIVQTDRNGLAREVRRLLGDRAHRDALAHKAREVVMAHQGATSRYARLLESQLRHATDEKSGQKYPEYNRRPGVNRDGEGGERRKKS
ncbi:MAG: hypothetical protein EA377_04065 [Phycisphaerales bacterium]|nr:MAG: hypothetical protein EA377_04065 [Phycisphaerales bacterium]